MWAWAIVIKVRRSDAVETNVSRDFELPLLDNSNLLDSGSSFHSDREPSEEGDSDSVDPEEIDSESPAVTKNPVSRRVRSRFDTLRAKPSWGLASPFSEWSWSGWVLSTSKSDCIPPCPMNSTISFLCRHP